MYLKKNTGFKAMLAKTGLAAYKAIVPKIFRNKITLLRNASGLSDLRKNIIAFFLSSPAEVNEDVKLVLKYLKNNPVAVFPYKFSTKYPSCDITVLYDKDVDLKYVLHEGKKLFFKRKLNVKGIKDYYAELLIEQDLDSPHRYLNDAFTTIETDVVADVGAAEGIFALSVVDRCGKLFLFEADEEWIEALRATFKPWESKVVITNKFVSDRDNEDCVSLDVFITENQIMFSFIKVDVDGAESLVLKGAQELLHRALTLRVAICTYHGAEDENLFRTIFEQLNFTIQTSKGYMVFYHDKQLSPPYLRRGLLRATRELQVSLSHI